uniref:D-alanyl-D-alanine carboxypeptidase n=1 Tax=Klebsiella pneumoniae TaxID=573 RepID=A0A2U8T183_KLEPN|nr:D-alanyl-D-alanine carboxypeptidase [Klebsiella pneumoniae]
MRKSRTPGSVRGVSGNGYPYRDMFNSVTIIQIACLKNILSK